jgi:hypothetical protein
LSEVSGETHCNESIERSHREFNAQTGTGFIGGAIKTSVLQAATAPDKNRRSISFLFQRAQALHE